MGMIRMNSRFMRTRLTRAILAAGLAGGLLAAGAAPAGAGATPGHVYRVAPASPAAIRVAPATTSATSTQVINYNSNYSPVFLCLGIFHGNRNASAVQWGCNGNPDQQWHWGNQNSTFAGWYQLVNDYGQCLGVGGGSLSQGAQVVGWDCYGSSHLDQYWKPYNLACSGFGGPYLPIQNLNSFDMLSVAGDSMAQGANVVQWSFQRVCNNQFWWYGLRW
jgi:Ricin-type beta-trefoil lectin domain-like